MHFFQTYIKYLFLFIVLGWLAFAVQVYVVMEPFEIYPRYYIVPALFIACAALISTLAEIKGRKSAISSVEEEVRENRREPVKPIAKYKKDRLRGAFTKDAFNEIFGLKIIEAKHVNTPLSLIIFDIDYFKQINDTYGHLVGDSVLRELAQVVQANMRQSEYFVRWGGEEFILLLPGTDLYGAQMVAEKLRRIVEKTEFSEVGKVTCSFGVTTLRSDDTMQSFLQRADEALYEAKRSGRNQVKVKK